MKNKLIILLFSLVLTANYLFFIDNHFFSIPSFEEGQVAHTTILAPFDFDVPKSENLLQKEKEKQFSTFSSFLFSEENNYTIQEKLTALQEHFLYCHLSEFSIKETQNYLESNHFSFSTSAIKAIQNIQFTTFFQTLQNTLIQHLEKGIISNENRSKTIVVKKNNLTAIPTEDTYFTKDRSKKELLSKYKTAAEKLLIEEILLNVNTENIIKDSLAFELELSQKNASNIVTTVLKDEEIISKNKRVTTLNLLKLNALEKQLEDVKTDNATIIKQGFSFFGLTLLTTLFFVFVLKKFFDKNEYRSSILIVYFSFVIFVSISIGIVCIYLEKSEFFVPITTVVFLSAFFVSKALNFVFTAFLQFYLFLLHPSGFPYFTILSMSALTTIFYLYNRRKRNDIFPLILVCFLLSSTGIFFYKMLQQIPPLVIFRELVYNLLFVSISVILAQISSPFFFKILNISSRDELLNLLDFNNPVLKELSTKATGTYHHSLIVGNLAESIAAAIQANPLLARVGSYYHDIGKLTDSHLFIENNSAAPQFHDLLHPQESAKSIRSHVTEGIALAKKFDFPKPIIDIIEQHHGNSKIRYFLAQAKEIGLDVKEEDFRYFGPKPQSKEAALVMIADIVESTTKSMDKNTTESIRTVVQKTIQNLLDENQLTESGLTLKDLDVIKKKLVPLLRGVYRRRLEYPKDE